MLNVYEVTWAFTRNSTSRTYITQLHWSYILLLWRTRTPPPLHELIGWRVQYKLLFVANSSFLCIFFFQLVGFLLMSLYTPCKLFFLEPCQTQKLRQFTTPWRRTGVLLPLLLQGHRHHHHPAPINSWCSEKAQEAKKKE